MNILSTLQPSPAENFEKHVTNDVRADKRKLNEVRKIDANINAFSNASGSCRVSFGKTVVMCGVKGELTTPSTEFPDHGFVIPNVELPALCSSVFKSGPPGEQAQTATKFLDNLLSCTNLVNREQLCITSDKLVWVLYCDIICLNYDGNLHDACVTALVLALSNVKLPTVTISEESDVPTTDISSMKSLKLSLLPVSSTFALYNKHLLLDPTHEEEEMTSGLMSVVMDEDSKIVYVEKTGGSAINKEQLSDCVVKQARDHSSKIREEFYTHLLKL